MEKKKELPRIDEEGFLTYLKDKGCNHRSYKMYSTIEIVNSTIDNKALYLSNGDNWNDVVDRKNFNNDGLSMVNFGRCLSYSSTESVAMWMLYGGMKHRGAMIDFDKYSILDIIMNTDKISVGYFDDNTFITLMKLKRNEFEIQLVDVVYTEQKGNMVTVKRSTGDKWEFEFNADSQKNILNNEKYTYVHKNKAWDYEQECRLIVSISKNILSELSEYTKVNMVRIDLKNINLSNTKRFYAPNVSIVDRSKLEFMKANPSELIDKVEWDLCDKCKK